MNLFTYGSLMFPEVWQRVTGLSAPGEEAVLQGHVARRIRGQSYPALVQEAGAETSGVLYRGVSGEAVARLDAFEGSFYERVEVGVVLGDGTRCCAWAYRAGREDDPDILLERWDAAGFAARGLAVFLQEDPGFSENGRS
jgi:hypothetical protein